MIERNRRGVITFALCCGIPVLFMVPGITSYPMTVAGCVVGAVFFLHDGGKLLHHPEVVTGERIRLLHDEEKLLHDGEVFTREQGGMEVCYDEEATRNRARPVTC